MDTFLIKGAQLLLSLSILIVLHELGHFIPAKLFKTRVEKFYLFFDVKFSLFKKKIGVWKFDWACGDFGFLCAWHSKSKMFSWASASFIWCDKRQWKPWSILICETADVHCVGKNALRQQLEASGLWEMEIVRIRKLQKLIKRIKALAESLWS